MPGWAIELVLIAALVPFLVAAVDLFARCRRRHIPLGPRSAATAAASASGSGRSRLRAFALAGGWPSAPRVPLPPELRGHELAGSAARARAAERARLARRADRLLPRRPRPVGGARWHRGAPARPRRSSRCSSSRQTRSRSIFVLPSLHAWLWLPHVPRPAVLGASGALRWRASPGPAAPRLVRVRSASVWTRRGTSPSSPRRVRACRRS